MKTRILWNFYESWTFGMQIATMTALPLQSGGHENP